MDHLQIFTLLIGVVVPVSATIFALGRIRGQFEAALAHIDLLSKELAKLNETIHELNLRMSESNVRIVRLEERLQVPVNGFAATERRKQ